MPDQELDQALKGSAMSRAKHAGIRRNIALSVANAKG
jgi:hypothetical protein